MFKCLKGNEKSPVFKYAGKQQEKLATWTMMDRFPFISIYSFPFIHEVKKCAKNASIWTDFSSCPNISQCSTPRRMRSYFCSCGWWTDLPFITIFKLIFIIHEVTSNLHRIFPSEQMNHKLTISPFKRKTQPCQVTNLHFRRRWQCLFVEGGGLQIPIWARKEMGRSHWSLNENKHKNHGFPLFSFSTL